MPGSSNLPMRLALFDLDGTVLRGNSWRAFFWWILRERSGQAPRLLFRLALRRARLIDGRALREATLRPLRGLDLATVQGMGERIWAERLRAMVRPAARREIDRARACGLQPVLATGTFDFLAAPIARELGIDEVVSSRVAFDGGRCTGCIVGPETRSVHKATAIQSRFAGREIDWAGSQAFTDDVEDAPLWALVGDPVLVRSSWGRRTPRPDRVREVDWESLT